VKRANPLNLRKRMFKWSQARYYYIRHYGLWIYITLLLLICHIMKCYLKMVCIRYVLLQLFWRPFVLCKMWQLIRLMNKSHFVFEICVQNVNLFEVVKILYKYFSSRVYLAFVTYYLFLIEYYRKAQLIWIQLFKDFEITIF